MKTVLTAIVLTLLTGIASLHAQSVKEVMQDKTGRFLYAQSRDSDLKVAYELANSELIKKVNEWCAAYGVTPSDNIADVQAHIHRINGEVLGQHRVFLFITTESLRNGSTEETSSELSEEVPTETIMPEDTDIEIADTDIEENIPEEIVSVFPAETVTTEPAPASEPDPAPAPAPVKSTSVSIPDGRIGDIISTLLGYSTDEQIVSYLAKEKAARGISNYGKGDTQKENYIIEVPSWNITDTIFMPCAEGQIIDLEK